MQFLDHLSSPSARVILSLALMLSAGFLMTRGTKCLHLPNVTGYILSGILIGPFALNLVPAEVIENMEFLTDVALAFIAFGVGRYFKASHLRQRGKTVLVITLLESLTAAAVIVLVMLVIFRLPLSFCLLLGAIGCATAPASTIMTIRQYRAKGEFVDTILQVVALDDAVALVAFSICAAVAQALELDGKIRPGTLLLPVVLNLAALVLGGLCGWLLHLLIDREARSDYHRVVLVTALVLGLSGCCTALDISPLLSCMLMGTVYINLSGDKRIFHQVNDFTPAILLLFFALSGMRLDLSVLPAAGGIGVVYFLVRIAGKYAGAWIGGTLCGTSEAIRRCLGLALIPQAGVSIGLAILGERMLPPQTGALLSTIILSSGVLYEIVGPACAKLSLFLSGTVQREKKDVIQPAPVPEAGGQELWQLAENVPRPVPTAFYRVSHHTRST